MIQKQKPWGKRKRRRGRWAKRDLELQAEAAAERNGELSKELSQQGSEGFTRTVSELDDGIQKGSEKSSVDDIKQEIPSSNVSEDSRSSFNDRKSKDTNIDSPSSSSGGKTKSSKHHQNENSRKRDREWDDSVESDESEDVEYIRMQKTQRRPKTRKLESNPLFWTVEDVFQYLRKTTDCRELAKRVKQEVKF